MTRLSFEVLGVAAPQGSLRPIVSKTTGRTFVKQSSKRTIPWRQEVAATAAAAVDRLQEAWDMDAPMRLELAFYLPRPRGHYGAKGLRPSAPLYPATRPDRDKLERACLDALTGIVWRDDAQVVNGSTEKLYALEPIESPRAVFRVTRLARTVGAQEAPRPLSEQRRSECERGRSGPAYGTRLSSGSLSWHGAPPCSG